MQQAVKEIITDKNFNPPGYDIIEMLGTGAHSSLWKVQSQKTGQICTLKRVVKINKDDARFFDQTINEYNVSRKIDHDSVRKVFSLNKIRKMFSVKELHLIMEFCSGQSLKQQPPRDIKQAVEIFLKSATALLKINQAGLVHADMKPDNIIVDQAGNVKIIDFGQCCELGTIKSRVQGTPDFIAPEQVHKQPLTAKTDVYNFGVTMYWCLTGKPGPMVLPPQGGLVSAPKSVQPPSKINPSVPVILDRVIMQSMELAAQNRPDSMKEIVSRLRIILEKLQA